MEMSDNDQVSLGSEVAARRQTVHFISNYFLFQLNSLFFSSREQTHSTSSHPPVVSGVWGLKRRQPKRQQQPTLRPAGSMTPSVGTPSETLTMSFLMTLLIPLFYRVEWRRPHVSAPTRPRPASQPGAPHRPIQYPPPRAGRDMTTGQGR